MTFGWEGADLSIVINHFDFVDKNIVIYFLDGSTHTLPNTEENRCKVLNTQINQAIERMNSSVYDYLKDQKIELGIREISRMTAVFCMTVAACAKSLDDLTVASVIGAIGIAGIMTKHIKDDQAKLDELTKYEIYLSIREKLDSCPEGMNILNRLRYHTCYPLTINDIDRVPLSDIKNIRNELYEYEQSEGGLSKTPQFIKEKSINNISE